MTDLDRRSRPFPRRSSRRQFARLALSALPAAGLLARPSSSWAFGAAEINSRIKGVRIGAITYSFRALPDANDIVRAIARIGLGDVELMSNHAEALAGAPTGKGNEAALSAWRLNASPDTWKKVRGIFDAAGLQLRLLCYNMNVKTFNDEAIEYGFRMAKGLGVDTMTTSTQVSMSKRVAPFADQHRIRVGYHGHANLTDPDEVATPASFATCLSYSKYHAINLDIGHFTAAGFDPVAFLKEHHAQITNLHLKDRRTPANGAANVAWGQGDTPIGAVLQLLRREKWDIPANIEFEYPGDPLVEVPKCFQFCKDALA
jgi:sugar phosphate isomerase/epimerase